MTTSAESIGGIVCMVQEHIHSTRDINIIVLLQGLDYKFGSNPGLVLTIKYVSDNNLEK